MNPSDFRIRLMRKDDLEEVLRWRNHPDVRRYMYSQHEIAVDEHRIWFERTSADPGKRLLICTSGEKPVGFVSFSKLRNSGVADWGFYLAPDAPKGAGSGLGKTALDYAFSILGLHKVCGQALAYNERSVKFHRRFGFREEGILRDQYFDGERYHAVFCFGLLGHEWQPHE